MQDVRKIMYLFKMDESEILVEILMALKLANGDHKEAGNQK